MDTVDTVHTTSSHVKHCLHTYSYLSILQTSTEGKKRTSLNQTLSFLSVEKEKSPQLFEVKTPISSLLHCSKLRYQNFQNDIKYGDKRIFGNVRILYLKLDIFKKVNVVIESL